MPEQADMSRLIDAVEGRDQGECRLLLGKLPDDLIELMYRNNVFLCYMLRRELHARELDDLIYEIER
jgi:hypothetical protein